MEQNTSLDLIELCKEVLRRYKPYPLKVLDSLMYDDQRYEESRWKATRALKTLMDNGIDVSEYEIEDDTTE